MRDIKPKTDSYATPLSSGPLKKEKAKPVYPTMTMQHDSFPEAKDMKVGGFHTVKLKLKKVGHSESRFQNSSEHEIHGIEVEHGSKKGKHQPAETDEEAAAAQDE